MVIPDRVSAAQAIANAVVEGAEPAAGVQPEGAATDFEVEGDGEAADVEFEDNSAEGDDGAAAAVGVGDGDDAVVEPEGTDAGIGEVGDGGKPSKTRRMAKMAVSVRKKKPLKWTWPSQMLKQ